MQSSHLCAVAFVGADLSMVEGLMTKGNKLNVIKSKKKFFINSSNLFSLAQCFSNL